MVNQYSCLKLMGVNRVNLFLPPIELFLSNNTNYLESLFGITYSRNCARQRCIRRNLLHVVIFFGKPVYHCSFFETCFCWSDSGWYE